MPYNVIILSSTVIALAFGSVFNLLVRRFVALEPGDEVVGNKLRGLILRLGMLIRTRISKLQARGTKEVTKEEHQNNVTANNDASVEKK